MIRIAVIEDNRRTVEQIRFLIDSRQGLEFVFSASSISRFVEQYELHEKLDIVLLDLDLDGINSLDHLKRLKRLLTATKVIIVTGFAGSKLLLRALHLGADGYYVKSSDLGKLLDIIESTHRGGVYLEPEFAGVVVREITGMAAVHRETIDFSRLEADLKIALSKREKEVINGLYQDLIYKEIAAAYTISINTVRHYVKSAYRKLGVNRRQELKQIVSKY